MTDRASEIQIPDAKPDTSLSAKLAGESNASIQLASLSSNDRAHGEQARQVLNQTRIEVPDNCSAVLKNGSKQITLDKLSSSSQDELTCLYTHSKQGKMPDGSTDGKAIFMPGTLIGKVFSGIDNQIWAGKVFDLKTGGLVNRVLGQEFIKAEVSKGPSWLDGKPSTIIDYKNTSLVAGFLRDEIREVKPGLYLGIAYARLPFQQHVPALFFALESKKK